MKEHHKAWKKIQYSLIYNENNVSVFIVIGKMIAAAATCCLTLLQYSLQGLYFAIKQSYFDVGATNPDHLHAQKARIVYLKIL